MDGPQFDIRPYVELKGEHSHTEDTVYDSWTLSGGVKGTLNFDLRLYGEILANDLNLFDYRTTVAGQSTYTFTKTEQPKDSHSFVVDPGATKVVATITSSYGYKYIRLQDSAGNTASHYYPDAIPSSSTYTYTATGAKIEVTNPTNTGIWNVWCTANGEEYGYEYTITVEVTY